MVVVWQGRPEESYEDNQKRDFLREAKRAYPTYIWTLHSLRHGYALTSLSVRANCAGAKLLNFLPRSLADAKDCIDACASTMATRA